MACDDRIQTLVEPTEAAMSSRATFRINDNTECAVGWDTMLETFFGQVYPIDGEGKRIEEKEDGSDATILWVGTKFAEIRTVDGLAGKLKPRAILPKAIRGELFTIEIN